MKAKATSTAERVDKQDFHLYKALKEIHAPRLPVLDGFESARRIKAFKPWLPVIAVSAYNIGEEHVSCIEAGCDAFIHKPLYINLLMEP